MPETRSIYIPFHEQLPKRNKIENNRAIKIAKKFYLEKKWRVLFFFFKILFIHFFMRDTERERKRKRGEAQVEAKAGSMQ